MAARELGRVLVLGMRMRMRRGLVLASEQLRRQVTTVWWGKGKARGAQGPEQVDLRLQLLLLP